MKCDKGRLCICPRDARQACARGVPKHSSSRASSAPFSTSESLEKGCSLSGVTHGRQGQISGLDMPSTPTKSRICNRVSSGCVTNTRKVRKMALGFVLARYSQATMSISSPQTRKGRFKPGSVALEEPPNRQSEMVYRLNRHLCTTVYAMTHFISASGGPHEPYCPAGGWLIPQTLEEKPVFIAFGKQMKFDAHRSNS